jgi:exopolysaccharide biosynthesis polyprenyl glycosylphosphotransferase
MMRRHLRRLLLVAVILGDAILVEVGLLLAYWVRFNSGWIPVTKGYPAFAAYGWASVFVLAIWLFVFYAFGLYRFRRTLSYGEEIYTIFRGILLGSLVVMAASFLYRDISFSRGVMLLSTLTCVVLLSLARPLYTGLFRLVRNRGGALRVAVVGGGRLAVDVSERIRKRPRTGEEVVGIILEPGGSSQTLPGIPVLGNIDQTNEIVEREKLDGLILTLPFSSQPRLRNLLFDCESLHLDLRFVPDLFELMSSRVTVADLEGIPLLGVRECPLDGWNRVWKRTFDLVISLGALAILGPLLLLIWLLVRFTSPGPVIYRQERIGRDGRTFVLYKFRTMFEDAEARTGPVWASSDDPRQTKLGRVLRRTNLDELPQFWNVARGDLSLVGPRPERPMFVDQFRGGIPRYFERHRVKSGITGWAQVNGLRGQTSIEERTRFDLFYVENWSLRFDVEILVRTVWTLLVPPRRDIQHFTPTGRARP